jgi:hypothetical protein
MNYTLKLTIRDTELAERLGCSVEDIAMQDWIGVFRDFGSVVGWDFDGEEEVEV